MGGQFRYALALIGMVFKSATSQRRAMLLRGFFSVISHLAYIPIWFVMFSYVPTIGGWGIEHALMAYGIAITSWGLVAVLAYGLRTLPQQIDHGELDGYLTLPQPVLISVALSTSKSAGLGEIIFGVGASIAAGVFYGVDLTFLPLFIVIGAIIFASGILLFASLGFWVRQFYASAEEIYFNFNLMASRPAPIFTGAIQVITLTLIPVGLMTHIPVRFAETHQTSLLLFIVLGTLAYAALAIAFFHVGLRHYESGNRFGVRG
jgi:ABC-2 type transport system permease protein